MMLDEIRVMSLNGYGSRNDCMKIPVYERRMYLKRDYESKNKQ